MSELRGPLIAVGIWLVVEIVIRNSGFYEAHTPAQQAELDVFIWVCEGMAAFSLLCGLSLVAISYYRKRNPSG